MRKLILDLCGGSGSWSKPYKDAGYEVLIVSLPKFDVRTYIPPSNVYGILAAPPCESFSNCCRGSVLHPSMTRKDGLIIVNACLKIIEKCNPVFWCLENPATGDLPKYLGKPKMVFQPWEFGDGWSKKTALWGKFNIPNKLFFHKSDAPRLPLYCRPKRGDIPSLAFCHKSALSLIPQFAPFAKHIKTDYDFRSITPPGFAKAFFEVNK